MDTKPDTIKISASHREEIPATYANLYVTVKGSSFISGDTAMKKAKEVTQLVETLGRLGVKEEAVKLQGVQIESSSGTLLKSSSAIYQLKIRCEELGQFAEMLDVIASQKNAALGRVEWRYNDDEIRERVLKIAIEKAKGKAEKVAASLGIKLLGVYDFHEQILDEEDPRTYPELGKMQARSMSAPAPAPSLNMDIQHSKNIFASVDIWYRVSAF